MALRCSPFSLNVVACLILPVTSLLLGGTEQEGTSVTLVGAFRVNVRSAPEIRVDTLVGKMVAGTQLALIDRQGNWYRVLLSEGKEGWVHADFARPGPPHRQLKVTPELVRIRESPRLKSVILARAARGIILQRLDKAGEWFRVRLPHPPGLEGWIRGDLVQEVPLIPVLEAHLEPQNGQSALQNEQYGVASTVKEEAPPDRTVKVESEEELAEHLRIASVGQGQGLPGQVTLLSVLLGVNLFIGITSLGYALLAPRDSRNLRR